MKFYLGIHIPAWLKRYGVSMFVARQRFMRYKVAPKAHTSFALDSGGFTELNKYGKWTVSPEQYVREVKKIMRETGPGKMDWASIQDWMVEKVVLKKTKKTVLQHQELTIRSYLDLMSLDDTIPWAPVLQGWKCEDYLRHLDMWDKAGIDLLDPKIKVWCVGSVCRRQATNEASHIIHEIARVGGLSGHLHGFGFKVGGILKTAKILKSADSLAWSDGARRRKLLLPECEGENHKTCANCPRWAFKWRQSLFDRVRSAGNWIE